MDSNPDSVASRFISQQDIESAKARRDEQWRAAYARLGQEPPPQPTEDVYDGRSLAEKLAANKIAKQEEWEEKTKLANQFRALEEDEVMFLDAIRAEEQRKELKRKREDDEELKGFMEAVAARNALPEKPPNGTSTSTSPTNSSSVKTPSITKGPSSPTTSTSTTTTTAKKPIAVKKNSLKGVIVKKKPSKSTPTPSADGTGTTPTSKKGDLKYGKTNPPKPETKKEEEKETDKIASKSDLEGSDAADPSAGANKQRVSSSD